MDKCEHYWDYISDWYGDPGVINGTMNIYYKECRHCGETAPWDGRHPEPDPDLARDMAIEDRELFGDRNGNDD